MSTTAKEALGLVSEGKTYYRTVEHADPFTDATANYVYIPETDEYVGLGEVRSSGTVVVSGTLRGRATDLPPVYENIRGGVFRIQHKIAKK